MTAPTRIALSQLTHGFADPAGTAGDAVNGNVVANDGNVRLRVHNTNSGSTAHVLTVNFARTVDGQAVDPHTYSVPAATTWWFAPFDTVDFGSDLLINAAHAELVITAFHG